MQYGFVRVVLIVLLLGPLASAVSTEDKEPDRTLLADPKYEAQTEIRPSLIPGAGNGLFALVAIKEGEWIGTYGGRLLKKEEYPTGNAYIATIKECAYKAAGPFRYIDGKDTSSHVTRINFAPKKINGVWTKLQNARIRQLCKSPYFIFVATRDIKPGEEIMSSYGPSYNYDRFMGKKDVQQFFCKKAGIDCSSRFDFES